RVLALWYHNDRDKQKEEAGKLAAELVGGKAMDKLGGDEDVYLVALVYAATRDAAKDAGRLEALTGFRLALDHAEKILRNDPKALELHKSVRQSVLTPLTSKAGLALVDDKSPAALKQTAAENYAGLARLVKAHKETWERRDLLGARALHEAASLYGLA